MGAPTWPPNPQRSARRGAAVARLWNALPVRKAELRQRDVVVQRLEDYFHATAHLRLRVGRVEQVSRQQRAGGVVELDDDARVGHGRGEALVARVVHDRVRVDRAPAADWLEREIDRHAAHAGRVRWML